MRPQARRVSLQHLTNLFNYLISESYLDGVLKHRLETPHRWMTKLPIANDGDKGDPGPGEFTTQLMRKTPAKNKTMAVWIVGDQLEIELARCMRMWNTDY